MSPTGCGLRVCLWPRQWIFLSVNNPQAFLEGDSTKLIEGSVVSFASIEVVNTPIDIVVLEENSTLIIPTIDSIEDTNIESEVGSDIILEDAIVPIN